MLGARRCRNSALTATAYRMSAWTCPDGKRIGYYMAEPFLRLGRMRWTGLQVDEFHGWVDLYKGDDPDGLDKDCFYVLFKT